MQRDPVCNMQVDENKAAAKLNHNGKDYFFWSQQCADKFKNNPQQYVQAALEGSRAQVREEGLLRCCTVNECSL